MKKLREQLATRDTQLVAAKAECHEAQEDLSANEAALAAALQTSEKVAKVSEAQHESTACLPVPPHMLGQGKVLRHAGQLQTQFSQ